MNISRTYRDVIILLRRHSFSQVDLSVFTREWQIHTLTRAGIFEYFLLNVSTISWSGNPASTLPSGVPVDDDGVDRRAILHLFYVYCGSDELNMRSESKQTVVYPDDIGLHDMNSRLNEVRFNLNHSSFNSLIGFTLWMHPQ